MSFDLNEIQLPARIYRRLLLLTDMWPGERAAPGSLLIRLHSGGSKTPFFWAGESSFLSAFIEVLGEDRSLYCMSGLYGTFTFSEQNICALGRYYMAEIRKVQPEGPYLLGGWCAAGFVSYEVAKLLQAEGQEVKVMVLLDRDVSERTLPLRIARRLYRFFEAFDNRLVQIKQAPLVCIKEMLVSKKDELLRLSTGIANKFGLGKSKPVDDPDYFLDSYPGDMQLVFVKWGLLGYFRFGYFQHFWKQRVLGALTIHIIDGKKHAAPNWFEVATLIKRCFDRADI